MMKKLIMMSLLFIGIAATSHAVGNNAGLPDPVKKAKVLQKELKLSDKQTEKIAAVYKESGEKYEKIKASERGNADKMASKVIPLRTATIKKIKDVLTPKQAEKFDKLIKEPKSASGGWSDGWTSIPSEN